MRPLQQTPVALALTLLDKVDEEYAYNASKEAYKRAMEDFFKPEFLNRLDDVIVFRPLEKVEQREVVIMESQYLVNRVEAQGISLTFLMKRSTSCWIKATTRASVHAPSVALSSNTLKTHSAKVLLRQEWEPGGELEVGVDDDHITFRNVAAFPIDTDSEPRAKQKPVRRAKSVVGSAFWMSVHLSR